jgi:2-C-methyl-D-erythritol 4-phosphate cytidylyltransferase
MARIREVRVVAGSKANIKVTTPEDMVALKAFFENQEELNG